MGSFSRNMKYEDKYSLLKETVSYLLRYSDNIFIQSSVKNLVQFA